jgi:hypothetical protein
LRKLKVQPESIVDKDSSNNELHVDFYGVQRYISRELYSEVWLDNHNFMLEKQIYNDDFFNFIRELVAAIRLPANFRPAKNEELTYATYYREWTTLLPAQRELYVQALDFLVLFIKQIMSHANDNEVYICGWFF